MDNFTGKFVVVFDKTNIGNYFLGGNVAMCIHGITEGQNINYQYCSIMLTKINSNGIIVSQDFINIEINPETNEVLDIFC